MPCSCSLPGFAITCSKYVGWWVCPQYTGQQLLQLVPALLGLRETGCDIRQAQGTVSSRPSCRRRQPKAQRHGRRGQDTLPALGASRPPGLDQRHKGLQGWQGAQGQGSLVLCSRCPQCQLDTFTSTTSNCSTTPCDRCFTKVGQHQHLANGEAGSRLQTPQPGLVPVASAKPLLSHWQSPLVTQRLKANAAPAAPSSAR